MAPRFSSASGFPTQPGSALSPMARVPAFGLVPHRDGQVLPREALRLDDQLQPQNAGFHGPPSLLQWTASKSLLPATQSEQALGAPAFSPVRPKGHTHQGCPPACHSQLVTEPSQSPLATPTAHPCCHSGQHVSPWPLPVASASLDPSHITLVICTPALLLQPLHWPLAWGPSHRGCRSPAFFSLDPVGCSPQRTGMASSHPPHVARHRQPPARTCTARAASLAPADWGAWGKKTARSLPPKLPPRREGHADKWQLKRGKCQARGC